jgi:hypothetical protein
MQVLVHVLVFQGILRRLLRRGNGGIEVLQLRAEAHADLERIRHVARESSVWRNLFVDV